MMIGEMIELVERGSWWKINTISKVVCSKGNSQEGEGV